MRWQFDEVYFDSRKEMLATRPWLKGIVEENPLLEDYTLYQCDRCGCFFASCDPSTDTGGIICAICDREVEKLGRR